MQDLLPAASAARKGLVVLVSGEEFLVAGVVVLVPGFEDVGYLAFGPGPHLGQWHQQGPASVGQFVFDPGQDRGMHGPGDESVAFQRPEALGQYFRTLPC
jgi:hypothetical protein